MNMLYTEQTIKAQENLQFFTTSKDTHRILKLANAYWEKLHLNKVYINTLVTELKTEACKIPFLKKNTNLLTLSLAPNLNQDNIYNRIVAIALSLLLSSMKIPVVLKGDYGYNHEIGLSEIIAALGLKLQSNMADNAIDLEEKNWAYVHLPYAYTSLQAWEEVRKDFAQKCIVDQILPLLSVVEGENIYNCIACAELQQNRFYANFLNENKPSVETTTLLHDNSNTAFLSLCSDFYWQTSSDIEVMYLKDWNLPELQNNLIKQAEKISSAQEAAAFIEQLLKGDMAIENKENNILDWQKLLIVNAAFIAQSVQAQMSFSTLMLNAEAALDAHRAYENLQALLPKIEKDI